MSESKKSFHDSETPFENESSSAERVQKIIAQAGIASRRDAEDLIREGQVTINGKTANLGDKATIGVDAIKVRGKLIHFTQNKVYYMIYKPKNVIAMINEDEEGRPTLKDLIGKSIKERVFTVGRMDFKGEGAIILTNDGDMAQKILKSNDIIRRYHVKVDRHPTQEDLARLARGGRIEGRSMHPYHVRVVENYARNALIEISFEGMGSVDVKQFFENKGFFPEKVARVGIGHISADKMTPGSFKKLQASSVEALFAQPELAKKTIERLTEKRTGGVRVVDQEDLQNDAERKRRGKEGDFVTKDKRTFSPKGFVRGEKSERSERPARGGRAFGEGAGRSSGRGERSFGSSSGRERSFGERSFSNKSGEGRSFEGRSEGRGGYAGRSERPARGPSAGRSGGSAGRGRPSGERSFSDRTGGGSRSEGFWGSRREEGSSEGRSFEGRAPRGRSEGSAGRGRSFGEGSGRSGGGAGRGRSERSFGERSFSSRSEKPARGGFSREGRPSGAAGRTPRPEGSGRARPAGGAGKGQVRFKRTVR